MGLMVLIKIDAVKRRPDLLCFSKYALAPLPNGKGGKSRRANGCLCCNFIKSLVPIRDHLLIVWYCSTNGSEFQYRWYTKEFRFGPWLLRGHEQRYSRGNRRRTHSRRQRCTPKCLRSLPSPGFNTFKEKALLGWSLRDRSQGPKRNSFVYQRYWNSEPLVETIPYDQQVIPMVTNDLMKLQHKHPLARRTYRLTIW